MPFVLFIRAHALNSKEQPNSFNDRVTMLFFYTLYTKQQLSFNLFKGGHLKDQPRWLCHASSGLGSTQLMQLNALIFCCSSHFLSHHFPSGPQAKSIPLRESHSRACLYIIVPRFPTPITHIQMHFTGAMFSWYYSYWPF